MNAMRITFLILLAVTPDSIRSQTLIDLRTQSKSVDFSHATSTLPVQTGTSLPGTCTLGALYFLTTAVPGRNLYACVATNTWALETGASASTGAGAPSGSCSAGSEYDDTVSGDTWFCATNGWQKALTTNNTGTFVLTGQAGTAPSIPSPGKTAMYFDSTARVAQSFDDTGNLATMVRPTTCPGAGELLQSINADGTVNCAAVVRAIGYTFDGGSSALDSGVTKYLTVPFACTISAWNLTVDAGTATVKIWKTGTGTNIPAVANSISSNGLSISSGTAIHSTDVSDFTTTAVTANDMIGFNLFAVSSATYANIILECRQ